MTRHRRVDAHHVIPRLDHARRAFLATSLPADHPWQHLLAAGAIQRPAVPKRPATENGGLKTRRLVMRPLTLADVDLLVELDADPQVMRYINGGRPTTRAEVIETVQESIGHRWLAYDKQTRELVGWFALRPTSPDETERELGYRLRRVAWGKGYATEGSRALITLAFTRLDAQRVWAQTMAVNSASRRVMERCGMRYVRTFHLDWPEPIEGTDLGDVEYELRKEG